MKQVTRILLVTAAAFAVATAFAQTTHRVFPVDAVGPEAAVIEASTPSTTTTYNLAVPAACGVYAAMYTCPLNAVSPSGSDLVTYAPHSGPYPFGHLYFAPGTGFLGDLGYATIDNVTTTLLSHTDNGKRNGNTLYQGYLGYNLYSETTTFHQQTGDPYTGSTTINYTTTTACCSSGRGASQHTTWTITGGQITVTQ